MNLQKAIESLINITELDGLNKDDVWVQGYRQGLFAVMSLMSDNALTSSSSSVGNRVSSENPRFPARSDEYAIASVSRGVLGETMTDEQWDRFKELLNQESFDSTFADLDPVIDDCYAQAMRISTDEVTVDSTERNKEC